MVGPEAVSVGTPATLQGKVTDYEDDPVFCRWIHVDGPKVTLEFSSTLSPRFTPVAPGRYVFRLDASDLLIDNYSSAEIAVTVIGPEEGRRPTATTGQATNVTATSATLNAIVNPNGLKTSVYFEWGTTPLYGNATLPQPVGSGMEDVNVSAELTGLSPSTTYYFRVVATNSAGTTHGLVSSFRTLPLPSPPVQGRRLAFFSYRDGNAEIYTMNVDGSGQTNITYNPSDDWDPSWSPDGTKIVFQTWRDGNAEIYIMNADGRNQRNITKHPAEDSHPDWSPDGRKIAFCSNCHDPGGPCDIYVMDVDGSNVVNLTHNLPMIGILLGRQMARKSRFVLI